MVPGIILYSQADIRNPSLQLCWQGLASLLVGSQGIFPQAGPSLWYVITECCFTAYQERFAPLLFLRAFWFTAPVIVIIYIRCKCIQCQILFSFIHFTSFFWKFVFLMSRGMAWLSGSLPAGIKNQPPGFTFPHESRRLYVSVCFCIFLSFV